MDGNFQSETRTLKGEATTQNVALASCRVNEKKVVVQPFGGPYQGAQDGSLPWVGSDRG
jgi:hypothetical protein